MDSVRQEALINLSFNIGQTRLRGVVKALGHMEAGDYESAGDEFYDSKWASQVGDRALEVCEMIKSGEYDSVFTVILSGGASPPKTNASVCVPDQPL